MGNADVKASFILALQVLFKRYLLTIGKQIQELSRTKDVTSIALLDGPKYEIPSYNAKLHKPRITGFN